MSRTRCISRKEHYTNAIVLSQEGNPLCTINSKRVKWYLKHNLATEVSPPKGYPRAIRLNFKSKYERDPKAYEVTLIENKCVLCGAQENLTLHHVIPHVIRKFFPIKEKSRSRQWCVLLCIDCHEKVEMVTQPLYKKDYPGGKIEVQEKSNLILRHLKSLGMLYRLEPEKYARLMAESGYMSEADIPPPPTYQERRALHGVQSRAHQTAIAEWGHKFIAEHGGIEGTKAYFRELFLEFKPPYVPKGYLDL